MCETNRGAAPATSSPHVALPHASFIGFTGTPLEREDKNTRAVFGDYISIYDIQRAVDDNATVPIYYESRLAKLDLPKELKPKIDEEFEEVTEEEEYVAGGLSEAPRLDLQERPWVDAIECAKE